MFMLIVASELALAAPFADVQRALEAGRVAASTHSDLSSAEAEIAGRVPEGTFATDVKLKLATGRVLNAATCEARWEVDCGMD